MCMKNGGGNIIFPDTNVLAQEVQKLNLQKFKIQTLIILTIIILIIARLKKIRLTIIILI